VAPRFAVAVWPSDRTRAPFEPLVAADPAFTLVAWDDPEVDWAGFDLVAPLGVWDYLDRRDELLAWCDRLDAAGVPVANPTAVVRWNTDKRYLAELGAAGVPTIPTWWVAPGEAGDPSAWPDGPLVVKPTVGAGSIGASRQPDRAGAAAAVAALHAEGRTAMVQPFQAAVDELGETAVVLLDGRPSHAIRKGPILGQDGAVVVDPADPDVSPRTPSGAELELAHAALAAAPFADLAYARVDLLPGVDGPLLVELELTEPNLFLATAEGAPQRLAAALRRRARPG
jgi:glutathione synthase/RimK-type ligase-like ATP-grasp enzyme